jgi:CubicO group peptidase (beta-lactamase class C family)
VNYKKAISSISIPPVLSSPINSSPNADLSRTITMPTPSQLSALEEHLHEISLPSPTATIPGVVLLATSSSSTTRHVFSTGHVTVSPDRQPAPSLTPQSSLWFASATKLLTSIAALQLVERGLWDLDRPCCEILPELGDLKVLTGFNDAGEPTFDDDAIGGNVITLRHLLSHSCGMGYGFLNPTLMKYSKWLQSQSGSGGPQAWTVRGTCGLPLLRSPGVAFEYGPGLEWAGALVEAVHGEETGRLGRVLKREIFGKLDVPEQDVGFRRQDFVDAGWSEQEFEEKWADKAMCKGGTMLLMDTPWPPEVALDDMGGAGLRCSADAYFRVLESLVRNDGRLLTRETVSDLLFQPQFVEGRLGTELAQSIRSVLAKDAAGRMMTGGLPVPTEKGEDDEVEYNHGLFGALSRQKGVKDWSLHWGGAPNIQWFISNEGVAGLFACQIAPPNDSKMLDLAEQFRMAAIVDLKRLKVRPRPSR